MRQLALGVRLRTDAVFANFAPGSNAELMAALQSRDATPLWVWGARGCGKTHLLQAVCASAGAAVGEAAAYFPLERGLNLPPEALNGFEVCRVLCLDDVGAVARDARWEQALFRLFNEAADLGTRLIFAAEAAPQQIHWTLDDWRSRAAACLVYQLRDLDEAGRVEALQLRAVQRGLHLPEDAADYLLRRMPRDLNSLFDVLDALDEASLVAQRRLTVPFIRAALEMRARTKPQCKTNQK